MSQGNEQRFAEIWSALDGALDWERLGVLHCHEGGEDFFDLVDRGALLEAGLLFADDLGRRLSEGGTSLYIGASVAELVPMLVESLVLGRQVLWYELASPIIEELAGALEEVERKLDCMLPRPCLRPIQEAQRPGSQAPIDHLWLVSVLSDPDAFPALHDRLYERKGEAATGKGDFESELETARALASAALRMCEVPALVTTSDEELSVLVPLCEELGFLLQVPDAARLSAVVGDPVRHCSLTKRT